MTRRILALYCANALLWLALVPPWQAPDEPKHLEYVRLLRQTDRVIAFETEEQAADPALQAAIVQSMDEHHFWWYGNAPGYDPERPPERFADIWLYGVHTAFYRSSPAYYWLAARLQPPDLLAGLYAARLVGALLGAVIVVFTAMAARELFPTQPFVRYGAPLVLALGPMFVFLQASVNSDVVVNVVAAFAMLLVVRLLVRGGSAARVILLLAATIAAALVKRTAVALAPVVALGVVAWLVVRSERPLHGLLAAAAAVAASGLMVAGVWRSAVDAPDEWRFGALRYLFNEPDQPARIMAYLRSPEAAGVLAEYASGMVRDMGGSFGWQAAHLPWPLQLGLAVVAMVAMGGVARIVLDRREPAWRRAALFTLACAPLAVIVAASVFFVSYLYLPYAPPAQGRYLMLAALPVAVLMTAGLGAWIPVRHDRHGLAVLTAALVAYNGVALFAVVVPYFYR